MSSSSQSVQLAKGGLHDVSFFLKNVVSIDIILETSDLVQRSLFKVIVRMFVLQHIIACGWFGVGATWPNVICLFAVRKPNTPRRNEKEDPENLDQELDKKDDSY